MLYCATSNNVYFCTTWQNGETQKLHFSLKCYIIALPEFNQSFLDFFNPFDSQLRRKEVNIAAAVGVCCTNNACAPMRCLPERKNVISDVFVCLTFVEIVILSINFHSRLDKE